MLRHVRIRLLCELCGVAIGVLPLGCTVLDPDEPGNLVPATVDERSDLPRFRTRDGVLLHARFVERGHDRTAIILHGGPGGDHRAYESLDALGDTVNVIQFDQRGAGLSQRVSSDRIDGEVYVQDVVDLLDAWSPQPVVLIGHSWGGAYAALFASQHPDRVSQLVLIEPAALTVRAAKAANSAALDFGDLGVHRYLDTTQYMGPRSFERQDWFFGVLLQNLPAEDDFAPGEDPAAVPFWRHGLLANQQINDWQGNFGEPTFDLTDELRGVTCPVLIISGDSSRRLGTQFQQQFHVPLFAQVELETVVGAGHFLPVFQPQLTVDIIRGFLRREAP